MASEAMRDEYGKDRALDTEQGKSGKGKGKSMEIIPFETDIEKSRKLEQRSRPCNPDLGNIFKY